MDYSSIFDHYLHVYNNNIKTLVCLSGYRLGPWLWYKLETSIIKTNYDLRTTTRKKFPKSDQWANYRKKVTPLMFFIRKIWLNIFLVHFERAHFEFVIIPNLKSVKVSQNKSLSNFYAYPFLSKSCNL
jgi:hypothetical protein